MFDKTKVTTMIYRLQAHCMVAALCLTTLLLWGSPLPAAPPTLSAAEILNTERTGTAQAGTTTSITLDAGASAVDDFYLGSTIYLTGGTGEFNARVITDYDGTTKVATVSPAWNATYAFSAPDATTTFLIDAGYQLQLTWDQAVTYQGQQTSSVVTDDFDGTDGADLNTRLPDVDLEGGGWITPAGFSPLEIQTNRARASANNVNNSSLINAGIADGLITTIVNCGASNDALRIWFRSDAALTSALGIECHKGDSQLRLISYVSGVRTVLGEVGFLWTDNVEFTLAVRYIGSTITVTIDGNPTASWTSELFLTQEYVGLYGFKTTGVQYFEDFDCSSVIAAKQLTLTGAPLCGSATNRTYSLTSVASGDATTVTLLNLPPGKPINSGETVLLDIEAGGFENGGSEGSAAIVSHVVTNNSVHDASPNNMLAPLRYEPGDTTITVESDAFGFFGNGDGISQVEFEADDGVNAPVSQVVTTRIASPLDGYRVFSSTLDLSTLDDGPVTITMTATSNAGLGTETDSLTMLYDGGGTLASGTVHVQTANGDDVTGDGTSGNPYQTPARAWEHAVDNSWDDYFYMILDEPGNYVISGGAALTAPEKYSGVTFIRAGTGLDRTDCFLVGDFAVDDQDIRPDFVVAGSEIRVKECALWTNNSGDPTADQTTTTFILANANIWLEDCEYNTGTAISLTSGFNESTQTMFWTYDLHLSNCTSEFVTMGGGLGRIRAWAIDNIDGDILQEVEKGCIGITVNKRASGHPAFAVSSENGNATVAKSTGVLTLTDDLGTHAITLGTILQDNFSDTDFKAINLHTPDVNASGNSWVVVANAPQIISNSLKGTNGFDNDCLIDVEHSDVVLTFTLDFGGSTGNPITAWVRSSDTALTSALGVRFTGSNQIGLIDQAETTLETFNTSGTSFNSGTHTITLTLNGSTIDVAVDGNLEESWTNATGQTNTIYGFRVERSGHAIDSLLMAPPDITFAGLLTQINALSGWAATRDTSLAHTSWDDAVLDGDGASRPGIKNFTAIACNTPTTIYLSTDAHSDVRHSWTGKPNLFYSGIASMVPTATYRPGAGGVAQGSNFGSAAPTWKLFEKLTFLNVQDVQWDEGDARTAFGAQRNNAILAHCTMLVSPMNLDYNGVNTLPAKTDLLPTNVIFTNNVFTTWGVEGTSHFGVDSGRNVYLHNNHVVTTSTIDTQDTALTNGSLNAEVVSFNDAAPNNEAVDMTPTSGSTLRNRVESGIAWHGFGDLSGFARATDGTGAIGALEYQAGGSNTAPVVSATTLVVLESSANGTIVGTLTATDAELDPLSGWTITAGNEDGVFALDSNTGVITVVDNTTLDAGTTPQYILSVTVSDGTDTSAPEDITINVVEPTSENDESYQNLLRRWGVEYTPRAPVQNPDGSLSILVEFRIAGQKPHNQFQLAP